MDLFQLRVAIIEFSSLNQLEKGMTKDLDLDAEEFLMSRSCSTDGESIFNDANDLVQVVRLEHHQPFRFEEILLTQGDNAGFIIVIFHVQNKVAFRNENFLFGVAIHNASLTGLWSCQYLRDNCIMSEIEGKVLGLGFLDLIAQGLVERYRDLRRHINDSLGDDQANISFWSIQNPCQLASRIRG